MWAPTRRALSQLVRRQQGAPPKDRPHGDRSRATLSYDGTDIEHREYDFTVEQLRANLPVIAKAQPCTEFAPTCTTETLRAGSGCSECQRHRDSDTVTPDDTEASCQQNFEDYLVEKRSRHVDSRRNRDLKLDSDY